MGDNRKNRTRVVEFHSSATLADVREAIDELIENGAAPTDYAVVTFPTMEITFSGKHTIISLRSVPPSQTTRSE